MYDLFTVITKLINTFIIDKRKRSNFYSLNVRFNY